jgi:xanthine dehydrogenase accessory factor
MLVTQTETYGTIGGGNLEWEAMRTARTLLMAEQGTCSVQVRQLVLGRELAQCCGGVVQLWVERFTSQDLRLLRRLARPGEPISAVLTIVSNTGVVRQLRPYGTSNTATIRVPSTGDGLVTLLEPLERRHPALWLYGAGHVGHALIHILGDLPFDVTWVDSRSELFPDTLPDNVRSTCSQVPVSTIDSAPPDALFLVMTHDHALDYDLCRRILERGNFGWLGLIGSKSKGARFRSRLTRDGLSPEQIARLTCPIGIDGVSSKLPAAIAVAVAAQLLQGVGSARTTDFREPAAAGAPEAVGVRAAGNALPSALASARADSVLGSGDLHEDCSSRDCETCVVQGPAGRRWVRP